MSSERIRAPICGYRGGEITYIDEIEPLSIQHFDVMHSVVDAFIYRYNRGFIIDQLIIDQCHHLINEDIFPIVHAKQLIENFKIPKHWGIHCLLIGHKLSNEMYTNIHQYYINVTTVNIVEWNLKHYDVDSDIVVELKLKGLIQ